MRRRMAAESLESSISKSRSSARLLVQTHLLSSSSPGKDRRHGGRITGQRNSRCGDQVPALPPGRPELRECGPARYAFQAFEQSVDARESRWAVSCSSSIRQSPSDRHRVNLGIAENSLMHKEVAEFVEKNVWTSQKAPILPHGLTDHPPSRSRLSRSSISHTDPARGARLASETP